MFSRNKRDNGVAMASMIIIVAVLAIMAAALLQVSYLAYSRKVVERRSTETFYTAESSIDIIKAAVQNSVASAIPKAEESEEAFAQEAYKSLAGITYSGTGLTLTSDSALYKFLYKKITQDDNGNLRTDLNYYNGYKSTNPADANGPTYIKDGISSVADGGYGGAFSISSIVIDNGKTVRIKDVYIKFVNKQGYVAEIKTDILVNAPIYASDISVPTGSYSMFAGCGASVSGKKDGGNILYIHQEGNVYIGYNNLTEYSADTITALSLEGSYDGQVYYSVGGTNIVINGNVYLTDGSTLIFSGGDGKETCNIQINGKIYMSDHSTLLLAPNINLVCKGIKVDDEGNGTYVDYTGTGVGEDILSQFYPAVESYISNKNSTYYSADFNSNKYDIAEMLQYAGGSKDDIKGNGNADQRYLDVLDGTAKCGVYMLAATRNSVSGFTNRLNNKYYLLTASNSAQTWTCPKKTGLYSNQITVSPGDAKLNLETKIPYGTSKYDREYARILNVPLVAVYKTFGNSKLMDNCYTNYKTNDNSTYSSYSWNTLKTKLNSLAGGASVSAKFVWNNINTAEELKAYKNLLETNPLFGDRTYRVPSDKSNVSAVTTSTLSVATNIKAAGESANKTFTVDTAIGVGAVGGQGVVNVSANTYCLYVSDNDLVVHTCKGTYSGIFLSAQRVAYEQSTGYTRGISLLELAKHTGDNTTIADDSNAVHKALEKLAGCWIAKAWSETFLNGMDQSSDYAGLNLFDNVFNGGVETFWRTSTKKTNTIDNNNSGKDFIDTDNWEKNPDSTT